MLQRVVCVSLCAVALFGFAQSISAVFYDVSVRTGDVVFSPPELILDTPTQVYATVSNLGERDVEGTVKFYDGDALIGTKPFSVRANVRPEDAWVRWTPQGYGAHTIRVVVENDDAFADAVPGNNTVNVGVFVDRDTDRDGVPDREDDDQDNDGILNVNETARGTDPFRRDTDGDGVDDRKDVFPLDAKRSILPPPVPTSTPRVVTPTPVRRPPAASAPSVAQVSPPVPVEAAPLGMVEAVTTTTEVLSVESTSTTPLVIAPETPQSDLYVTSSSPQSSRTSSWNTILFAAAALSAFAAAAFAWLGRTR